MDTHIQTEKKKSINQSKNKENKRLSKEQQKTNVNKKHTHQFLGVFNEIVKILGEFFITGKRLDLQCSSNKEWLFLIIAYQQALM